MKVVVLIILSVGCVCTRRFPDGFLLGAATSAYQTEGGWNASGKSENIWDHYTHRFPIIADHSSGDISADSYHHYKRDVEMMRELGLDAYRFSMSWSRILPDQSRVNEEGIKFYNSYIDEMLKYNITPIATIYHFDLPMKLLQRGGFANPEFPDWFERYARVAFQEFGDRVKVWITFNEPYEICNPGHSYKPITTAGTFICSKNLVLAHARAYHVYTEEFSHQGGVCGITASTPWFEALTEKEEDILATELARQLQWGLYTEPIFSKDGGFPKEISYIIAKKSFSIYSAQPQFTDDEKAYIQGSADFLSVNHYTTNFISVSNSSSKYVQSLDMNIEYSMPPEWPKSASSWLRQAPHSLLKILTHLHQKYNTTIIITENGWSTAPGSLDDDDRIRYYRAALEDVLDCLEAGVDVRGYMAWSLMDNFEWLNGYTECFGLYEVDFNSSERTRTPRKSAFFYKEVLRRREVDHGYEPINRTMWIDKGH